MSPRATDYALAVLSGLLFVLSFPKYGHSAFGWIALAPLLVALLRREAPLPKGRARPRASLGRAIVLGLITGTVYFAGTLYWITHVMVVYGGLQPVVAVLVNAALVAYLALFPALFSIIMRRLIVARGAVMVLTAPLVWVTTELGRTHLFGGFPWVLLGYSQVTLLPVAQFASVFGVYGLSALTAASSAAAAFWVSGDVRRPRVIAAAATAALIAAVAGGGGWRAARSDLTRAGTALRVGLVQGNVDQAEKWDPVRAPAIFQNNLRMTREAIGRGAQLVLWPESSIPFYFEEDRAAEQIRTLAREARVPILLGSDQIDRGAPTRYYNSAFLVQTDGSTAGVYRKMHLVPFGEYVPLRRVFFFAAPLVEAVSDFSAGQEAVLLPINGHPISTAICYEVVYPMLVRQFVQRGSELLTTITNDAWFGRTSAPYQHFAQASMRAIEMGRYLVRSANTGVSGVVDPYGRVIASSDIFQQTTLMGEARLLQARTLYARMGDVFAYACVLVTAAMLLAARGRRIE